MYVEAMGVLHGVFFSQFNAARDRKAMERLRPPPGGPLDTTVYEVMLQAKHVQLNTATTRYGQDPRALEALPAPAKHLVRIVGEDLSLDFRSGLRRPGRPPPAAGAARGAARGRPRAWPPPPPKKWGRSAIRFTYLYKEVH